jgi:hypothetical protein
MSEVVEQLRMQRIDLLSKKAEIEKTISELKSLSKVGNEFAEMRLQTAIFRYHDLNFHISDTNAKIKIENSRIASHMQKKKRKG